MFAGHLDLDQALWWTHDNVLSDEECQAYIDRFEQGRPELAAVLTADGEGFDERVRNNYRVMWDDSAEADDLVAKIRKKTDDFPVHFRGWPFRCANPRLRLYRYQPGQRHGVHWDTEVEAEGGVSRVTLVVYLNDDFRGGQTEFPELEVTVRPQTGRGLLFQHRVLHEACEVTSGSKYVLRTDLIYDAPATD